MRQLRERITVALNLQPFSYRDVREYISTRLSAAGYNGPPLFSDDAGKLIAAISQGLSRRINVLADKSMLSAFERNGLSINYSDSKRAAKDVKFGKCAIVLKIPNTFRADCPSALRRPLVLFCFWLWDCAGLIKMNR